MLHGSDDLNRITEAVIGASIEVHRHLGPGLLESVYEKSLVHELGLRSMHVEQQVPLPMFYKGQALGPAFRVDLVVEKVVIVEVKATLRFEPVHAAQALTYLRLSRLPAALLINFHVPLLRNGIRRFLNDGRAFDGSHN